MRRFGFRRHGLKLNTADERGASAYLDRALLVEHARSACEEESANARAYLLTGSEASLTAAARERTTFEADFAQLRDSAAASEERALLERVDRRDVAYEESVARVVALRRANASEADIRADFEASVVPAKTELDTALLADSARAQRQVARVQEAAGERALSCHRSGRRRSASGPRSRSSPRHIPPPRRSEPAGGAGEAGRNARPRGAV